MITKEFILECEQYIKNGGILSGSAFSALHIPNYNLTNIEAAAEEYIERNHDLCFTDQLFAFIDRAGLKDSVVYKKALIDRRLFSKIRSSKQYIPCKKTVTALCLALELERGDADLLLTSAGYSLSKADNFDLVVAFCIERRVFDFLDINEVLDHFGYEPF